MNPGQTDEMSQRESQEQPEKEGESQLQPEQKEAQLTSGEASSTTVTPPRKRRVRREKVLSEAELTPRSSYWPLALAVALSILLLGVVSNLVVLSIGAVLVIVTISGWALERR